MIFCCARGAASADALCARTAGGFHCAEGLPGRPVAAPRTLTHTLPKGGGAGALRADMPKASTEGPLRRAGRGHGPEHNTNEGTDTPRCAGNC